MSGGGKIIEKRPMTLPDGRDVIRYHVIDEYRPGWFDETCVYAEPADEEPKLGEAVWWQSGSIYFGPQDSKKLVKVGFSFRPNAKAEGRQ